MATTIFAAQTSNANSAARALTGGMRTVVAWGTWGGRSRVYGCAFVNGDIAALMLPSIVTQRNVETWGHELGHVIYGMGHNWLPGK